MKPDLENTKALSRRAFAKAVAGVGAAALTGLTGKEADAQTRPPHWDLEADVVVVGAGATGLPAAIEAIEHGASVILVEANFDVGGHAIVSGGHVGLGGGTSRQKKFGIVDSPDLVYRDLTDWSVVEASGFPDYRYNDRELIRAFADHCAESCEFLIAHGVVFVDEPPPAGDEASGNSAPRENHAACMAWPLMQTGKPVDPAVATTASSGIGVIRPLEAAARKAGVKILLKHHMESLVREQPTSGRILGIKAISEGKTVNIRARKGVILGTGGSTNNVNFRRIFDPRLTEEYCGIAGEPYSFQDASGELAGLAIGATLWGTYNASGEFGVRLVKAVRIGCQYGYGLEWQPGSPVFHLARARGIVIRNYQNAILVNQAGLRFYDEMQGGYTSNEYGSLKPYTQGSYRNASIVKYRPDSYLDAALAGTGEPVNGGGPIWAIFDANAVKREKLIVEPPYVDKAEGFFFSANSVAELAAAIVNKFQRKPMPGATLESTVARYNSFVDAGKDADFEKAAPKYKIDTAPFYAAWATPVPHDSRAGLRINAKAQVMDYSGNVIPGLYAGGECSGGISQHGMAKGIVFGRIAGINAASEPKTSKA